LAVVAPLGDVVGCADSHHARGWRHESSCSTALMLSTAPWKWNSRLSRLALDAVPVYELQ
jgi:hypothetical protein